MTTKIEWCDETINPIQDTRKGKSGRGYHCTKCSPGCDHCYAERINNVRGNGHPFADVLCPGPQPTFELVIKELKKPISWKRPRAIFWQSMGDIFHPDVPIHFIDKIMAVIAMTPQHHHLILTKREKWLQEYFLNPYFQNNVGAAALDLTWSIDAAEDVVRSCLHSWPQLYKGLTICNQEEWKSKKDAFLSVPGNKFISHEPALEAIDYGPELSQIGCLIAGGETGSGARPSHPDIFRRDRDQCAAAGTDFFFKQWGEWLPANQGDFLKLGTFKNSYAFTEYIAGINKHTLDAIKVGRNKAGRLLDGREHNDLPWRIK